MFGLFYSEHVTAIEFADFILLELEQLMEANRVLSGLYAVLNFTNVAIQNRMVYFWPDLTVPRGSLKKLATKFKWIGAFVL